MGSAGGAEFRDRAAAEPASAAGGAAQAEGRAAGAAAQHHRAAQALTDQHQRNGAHASLECLFRRLLECFAECFADDLTQGFTNWLAKWFAKWLANGFNCLTDFFTDLSRATAATALPRTPHAVAAPEAGDAAAAAHHALLRNRPGGPPRGSRDRAGALSHQRRDEQQLQLRSRGGASRSRQDDFVACRERGET